jgi:hypothetical protein
VDGHPQQLVQGLLLLLRALRLAGELFNLRSLL